MYNFNSHILTCFVIDCQLNLTIGAKTNRYVMVSIAFQQLVTSKEYHFRSIEIILTDIYEIIN